MNYYLLCVLLHIIGLSMVAAGTIGSFMAHRRFWHLYLFDRLKAEAVIELNKRFPVLLGVGMLLLIVSGVWLLVQTKGAYGEQVWFRLKMILVVLVIVSAAITRRMGNKINSLHTLTKTDRQAEEQLMPMKRSTTVFYVVQLVLLAVIFTLGVFKFN